MKPETRKEKYLAAIAGDAVQYPAKPITREEAYLDRIAKNGGGESGTTNYNALENKPSINSVTLQDNLSASDLGLVAAVAGKGLSKNDYTDEDKGIVGNVSTNLAGKVDKVAGKGLSKNDYTDADKAAVTALGTASTKAYTTTIASGNVDLPTSEAVNDAIKSAITSAYKAGGAKACDELTSALLVATNEGFLYNISDTGTTTADFIEGAGKAIGVGADVAVIKVGDVYKFNLMPGLMDLSSYMQKGVDYVTAGRKANTTVGTGSTAEGSNTTASGDYSHAEGLYTQTGADYQHVQGKYNVGKVDTLFEIGNGTADNARSNAFEVDSSGNIVAAGTITDGNGNVLGEGNAQSVILTKKILSTKTRLLRNKYKNFNYYDNFNVAVSGSNVWTDGEYIYQTKAETGSSGNVTRIFNRLSNTWDIVEFINQNQYLTGQDIWTDGKNTYYSIDYNHCVLDKENREWKAKTFSGLTFFRGVNVWHRMDPSNQIDKIFYSDGTKQYYLSDAVNGVWSSKSWSGLTNFKGQYIWTDGKDYYYSKGSEQYKLNGSTWDAQTWNGVSEFNGSNIWSDGEDIYLSDTTGTYILDIDTSTWTATSLNQAGRYFGSSIWTDGYNIYLSDGSTIYYIFDTLRVR